MKSSLKKVLALLLVLAMAVSVVACSSAPADDSSSTPDTTPADDSQSTPADNSGDAEAEGYTITVSVQASDDAQAGWEAVAAGYKEHHPEANIVIDLKPQEGYAEWCQQTASTWKDNTVDIVNINLAGPRQQNQTINWNEYMDETNPYDADGKAWRDTFEYSAQTRDPADNSFDALSLFSVQVKWFYNADIFAECEVEPPTTWDEFVDVCEKIAAKGYQPIAIEGDYNSFYAGAMGWLAQIYIDQTTRTNVEITRAQEGDYCYDPDIDGNFKLDLTDPWNDDAAYFTNNPVRFWAGVQNGTLTANTPGTVAVWENFKKIFPQYAGGDAFFGTISAKEPFYQGKAAIRVDGGWFALTFANDMAKLAAGEEITSGEDVIADVQQFELGSFNMPSMTNESGEYGADEIFQAPVRTIEVSNGFLGSFSRTPEQDAHVVDFMMYYSSAEGMSKYLDAMFAAKGTVSGPCLVYDVTYPDNVAKVFENSTFIGNCQKGYGQAFARGLAENQESTRAYYDLAQQCLTDQITPEQYAEKMGAQHLQYFETVLPKDIALSDLENPANEPVGNEAEAEDEG